MSEQKNKTPKKKGPIRTEFVIPVFIVFALMFAYGYFFMDQHLRWGVEKGATYIHGAEVNLANFESSFFGGYAHLKGLQVTDKENPTKNMLEIGQVRFQVLWDALLRAKLVIDEASITDIKVQSPRKRKGWVRPPAPPGKEGSAIQKLENTVLNQVEEQNEKNLLGSLSQVAQGVSEKEILDNIQNELQAEKKIKELKAALKDKEEEWKERIDNLPKSDDFKKLEADAKKLKFDTKDPLQFAKDLKDLKSIIKQADSKIDEIKKSSKDLKSDVGGFNKDISSIDEWIEKDIADIEKRLKIPKLDPSAFSKSLFMKMFADKLVAVRKYSAVAQEYVPMPNLKKKKEETKIIPRERGEGRMYKYPIKKGYPLFWIKKSLITSKSTPGGLSGDIEGSITNVTNNQVLVGQPTLMQIKGGFPNQNIRGIFALGKLDHRKKPFQKTLDVMVGSYPLRDLNLSESKDATLKLTQADATAQFNASLIDDQVNIGLKNKFQKPQFDVASESKSTQRILADVVNNIPLVTLDAYAKGRWDKLRIDIDTNLGRAISDSFQRFMKAEVKAIKEKIKAEVDSKIKGEKAELDAEYKKLKSSVDKLLGKKEQEMEGAKDDIEKIGKSSSSKKDKAKDDLKEKGKELLKKLKF